MISRSHYVTHICLYHGLCRAHRFRCKLYLHGSLVFLVSLVSLCQWLVPHGNGQESARQEEDAGVDRGRKEWRHYLAGSASLHFASRARVEGGVGAWEAWSKGEGEWSCSLAWAAIAGLVRRVSMQDVSLLFKIRDGTPELGSGKGERDSLGCVWLLAILRHQSLSTKPSALILSVHSQSLAPRVSQERRCSNRSDTSRRRSCCSSLS